MTQVLDLFFNFLCIVVSFGGVCVSLHAVRESRKSALTGTYFSEMTAAYAEYLRCVCDLVYKRGTPERDAIVAALYRLRLFAPISVCNAADALYARTLDFARTGQGNTLAINSQLDQIGLWFAQDLEHYRLYGTHASVDEAMLQCDLPR